jgi:HEAT repeat protein
MRCLTVALCAALLLLPGCKKADPKSVEDQIEALKEGKNTKLRLKALENLRAIGSKDAVPGLIAVLADANPVVKEEIARILGELKDTSAVQPLADAIDYAVGGGSDKQTQDANSANKEIARALGDLGDRAAVKPLLKLLRTTKDNYVRVEALGSLGRIKDPQAVTLLSDVATDERLETFINKKAIQALTEINSPEALPTYMRMLFVERRGVSFYPESAFGIFLLGDAAKDAVLAVLKDEDKSLLDWAKERSIIKPALYAKAAQLESDLQDPRAVAPLIKLLKYEDEDENAKGFVRTTAADTLGRMQAREALGPISAMLSEEEAGLRAAYVRALVQLGDKAAVRKLLDCSGRGNWFARDACMLGVAMLGGGSEIKAFDGFAAVEGKLFMRECEEGIYGDVDCAQAKQENVEDRNKNISRYRKVLQTISACSDNKCVANALNDPEPLVRERAAYELGRRRAADSLWALFEAIKRPVKEEEELRPRFAAICAVDWIASSDPGAKSQAKAAVPALEQQVAEDSRKTMTMKIAEEVKRLAVKLGR